MFLEQWVPLHSFLFSFPKSPGHLFIFPSYLWSPKLSFSKLSCEANWSKSAYKAPSLCYTVKVSSCVSHGLCVQKLSLLSEREDVGTYLHACEHQIKSPDCYTLSAFKRMTIISLFTWWWKFKKKGFGAQSSTERDNWVLAPAAQGCMPSSNTSMTSDHTTLIIPEEQTV